MEIPQFVATVRQTQCSFVITVPKNLINENLIKKGQGYKVTFTEINTGN